MADEKKSRIPVATQRTGRGGSTVDVRPLNCGAGETEGGRRCQRCKQFHLRPGYCQALDPVNAAQYPEFHGANAKRNAEKHGVETATDISVASEINELDEIATDTGAEYDTPSPDATDNATDSSGLACETCGATFKSRRADARYCSAACRSKAHRKGGAD